MKIISKNLIVITACFISLQTQADDLEAIITDTEIGMNNGAITLVMHAGNAPFVFFWTGPDGFTSSEQNISELAAGEYCITVTDAFCGTAELCVNIVEKPVAVEQISSLANISIFPNPFSNFISLGGSFVIEKIELTDLSGKEMFAQGMHTASSLNGLQITIPAALSEGMYILKVTSSEGMSITRQIFHRH